MKRKLKCSVFLRIVKYRCAQFIYLAGLPQSLRYLLVDALRCNAMKTWNLFIFGIENYFNFVHAKNTRKAIIYSLLMWVIERSDESIKYQFRLTKWKRVENSWLKTGGTYRKAKGSILVEGCPQILMFWFFVFLKYYLSADPDNLDIQFVTKCISLLSQRDTNV